MHKKGTTSTYPFSIKYRHTYHVFLNHWINAQLSENHHSPFSMTSYTHNRIECVIRPAEFQLIVAYETVKLLISSL